MILRDKDASTGWASSADSTRDERLYYCQNFRHDVVQTLRSNGSQAEKIRYSAYGIPLGSPVGDTDFNGQVGFSEPTWGGYDVREDFNLDGSESGADAALVTLGQTMGWNVLSRLQGATGAYNGNRKGYAGYEIATFDPSVMHVRNRVYLAELGRWSRRDPIGFAGGMNVYGYANDRPVNDVDPMGLRPESNPCILQAGPDPITGEDMWLGEDAHQGCGGITQPSVRPKPIGPPPAACISQEEWRDRRVQQLYSQLVDAGCTPTFSCDPNCACGNAETSGTKPPVIKLCTGGGGPCPMGALGISPYEATIHGLQN